ncbi:MAG TPA: formate/nitrite transporter family protein [Acidimicrobiales bacterium]|nr:formate/nitrite transporter family protein [Acidimicrobiales bacterium]
MARLKIPAPRRDDAPGGTVGSSAGAVPDGPALAQPGEPGRPEPPELDDELAVRPPVLHDDGRPREESIERSIDRIVLEGRPRLARSWPDLLATGVTGGLEVAFGVLALLVVVHDTGSLLLGGLAFSVGFVGLLLGHSELFTEGFLVPVTVVAAGEANVRALLRLWIGTLAGNLAGGALIAWIIDSAFPSLGTTAIRLGSHYVRAGVNAHSFSLGILAGAAITLLTRMHNGTDSDGARIVASVAIAFVLAGAQLFHSVLDSIISFVALDTTRATFGYAAWLEWFAWIVLANLTGGLGLTTVLRLVRSRHRLADHRAAAADADHG